jgi:hypothetical protein
VTPPLNQEADMPHPQDVAVPSLPEPDCTYADHSYPAYSRKAVERIVLAAVIADRAAGRASAEPEGWRPIDTAPTQGKILLWWKNAGAVTGGFAVDDDWTQKSKTPREGWKGDGDEAIPRNQEDCTHWQLLRAPAGNPWPRFSDRHCTQEWLEGQYAAPTPTASESTPGWLQCQMLKAAARSGDEGTIRLAAQLAGCLPCLTCDFIQSACRCAPKAEGEAHQIITLCGSARFERLFKAWNEALTMAGHTVFGLTAYPSDKAGVKQWYSDEQKAALDAAHFRKIEASDAIFVINRNAYIGHSTMNEIEHARKHGKAIYFLESWGKGNGPIDSASPIDTTTRSGSRCPWSSRLLGPAGAVRNAIVELTRGAESDTAPVAQAAVGASDARWEIVREVLSDFRLSDWTDADGEMLPLTDLLCHKGDTSIERGSNALNMLCDDIIAALSPRPSADADRASGGGVDTERLDWLLANPNTVLEDAGNEWFILDADSEPTYFKSGREAIDAARATPTTKD